MYTHTIHTHTQFTHKNTVEDLSGVWAQPPVFQYCVSKLLEALAVVICAVGGATSACTDDLHLTMFTENYFVHRVSQARTDTSPVWLLSVSCHSVHTDLFRVPRGCFTCKDFVFPSVMCPQCPVFRVLVPCSTHFHSASLKTSPWAKVAPWCPSTGDTHCHLWSVFLCEGRHSVSMAVRPCEAVCVVSTQVLLPAPPCPEHW